MSPSWLCCSVTLAVSYVLRIFVSSLHATVEATMLGWLGIVAESSLYFRCTSCKLLFEADVFYAQSVLSYLSVVLSLRVVYDGFDIFFMSDVYSL
jgi:hypothetical protein